MHLLILGGTAQLGRAVAIAASDAGHDVTCFARGRSGEVPDGSGHVVGDRDRGDGLAPLRGTPWDCVIDVSREPGQVRRAVAELEAQHWIFVSTINVYADPTRPGDESDAVVEPLEGDVLERPEDYGRAKVACEQAVLDGVPPERALIVRPGLLGGPEDSTDRSSYWPWRMSHAVDGKVLMPREVDQPVQLLDVRDLADWIVRCAADRIHGIVDTVGAASSLGEVLAESAALAAEVPEPVVVTSAWLTEQRVAPWMGPRSLPLWLPDPSMTGMMQRSGERARDLGLVTRPLRQTLRAAMKDADRRGSRPWMAGLDDAQERELIRLATS